MAGKRVASSDLNHDNWDRDEEPEEAGQFKEADENELKTRVIKKARRRITDSSNADDGAPKSIFGGFTGFNKPADSTTTTTGGANKSSLFSFLSKIPSATVSAGSTPNTFFATTTTTAATSTASTAAGLSTTKQAIETDNKIDNSKEVDEPYHAKVIKLNQSFCEWIKKHVDEEPLCNLMVTFKDYEKYWKQLEEEKKSSINASSNVTSTTSVASTIFSNIKAPNQNMGFGAVSTAFDSKNGFSFGNMKSNGNAKTTISPIKPTPSNGGDELHKMATTTSSKVDTTPKPFSFGIKPMDEKPTSSTVATALTSSSSFSFGLKKVDDTATAALPAPTATPFSFGIKASEKPSTSSGFSFTAGSVPFSFGNIKPPASDSKDNNQGGDENNDDDEDEPPKVEIKEIVEEDAFYTKKCKVFLKKDNAYKDFGIAMLYLKSIEGTTKTQLLVRSSPLGKILINTLLAEGTPVQRVGKNNVMIIYPNADGETQTNLIRVKDASEADDLLETINKHKK